MAPTGVLWLDQPCTCRTCEHMAEAFWHTVHALQLTDKQSKGYSEVLSAAQGLYEHNSNMHVQHQPEVYRHYSTLVEAPTTATGLGGAHVSDLTPAARDRKVSTNATTRTGRIAPHEHNTKPQPLDSKGTWLPGLGTVVPPHTYTEDNLNNATDVLRTDSPFDLLTCPQSNLSDQAQHAATITAPIVDSSSAELGDILPETTRVRQK